MKSNDLDEILLELNNIKQIALQQPYDLATNLNKHISKIQPILVKEKKRMEDYNLNIDSPQINIINVKNPTVEVEQEAILMLNKKVQELVEEGFEIIDFGLFYKDNKTLQLFIKYRS